MSVFESTLQTLLAHTETLDLSEGDYLQVCNAMKEVFQKKPEEKKIQSHSVNTTPRVIKMKGYTFECLKSEYTVYYTIPTEYKFKVKQTNPKGVITESTIEGQWSEYIQKMIRFLRPQKIEQTYDCHTEETTLVAFMEDAKHQDIVSLEMEKQYRESPAYEPNEYDEDDVWRGDYSYGRFIDQYRVMC